MILALLGLVLAWAIALLFGAMEFDRGLLLFFYAGDRPGLARAAGWVTELGGGGVLLAATGFGAGLLLYRRDWRGLALLIAVTLSGRLLVELQKDWTARLRPDPHGHLVPVETFAFPSGHAANAALVWLCLALLVPRRPRLRALAVWAAVWLALAVGASRVMLGVHWPSDVIGGWAFGLFWTLALLRLSGHPLDDGTPTLPPHCPTRRRAKMADRTRPDDHELIDSMEEAPSQSGVSGGNLQRKVAARAEEEHVVGGNAGVTRVRARDKKEEADLPRFNER